MSRRPNSNLSRALVSALLVAAFIASGCPAGDEAQVEATGSHDDASVEAETREDGQDSDGAAQDTSSGDYIVACDAPPPADPGPGVFWATCEHNAECVSGWCLEVPSDGVRRCHHVCALDCCPAGFVCRWAPGPLDDQFLCFPDDDA